jgi:uncharacterized protein
MSERIRNAKDRSRYELVIDGKVIAVADYRTTDHTVVLSHTEVLRHRRGDGVAARLVKGTLDDLRAHGKRVIPACWYVREFIDDNDEYADLVA